MRSLSIIAVTLVAIAGMALLATESSHAQEIDDRSTFVDYGGYSETDGEYVVWTQEAFDNGRNGTDLFAEELATGERTQILDSHLGAGNVDIDDGVVVWTSAEDEDGTGPYRVYGYDLDEERTFGISDTGNLGGSTVSNDTVVWRQTHWHGGDDYSHEIVSRDIRAMSEPAVIRQGDFTGQIRLDGTRILWQEQGRRYHWRLMTMELGDDEAQIVGEGSNISPGGSFGYDVSGNLVVYVDGPNQLVAVDLQSGSETVIPAQPYDQDPITDGRYVFWNGNDPENSTRDILSGFDMETGSRFTVHGSASSVGPLPSIGGNLITWRTGTGDDLVREIYLAPISQLLPHSPVPEPNDENPNRIWFPETGHSIVFGFKNFWGESGGLPVFGFPMTEEFDELNQDTGDYHTVQYFERQRYEYHPEHAGTPYEVQVGRLGYQDAERQGLLDEEAFQPIDEDPGDEDQCRYFAETGFAVCNEYLDYWQSHGLEFGDEGVSYRESLALFGYPISQPYFATPGNEDGVVTVQYFERARLEFHGSGEDGARDFARAARSRPYRGTGLVATPGAEDAGLYLKPA